MAGDSEHIWERQYQTDPHSHILKTESAKAFEAFNIYKDLGPARTYEEVSRQLKKKSTSTISRWAKDWDWQVRAMAWDDYLERQAAEAAVDEFKKMKLKHGQIGRQLQTMGVIGIMELKQQHDQGELGLSVNDICRLVDLGIKIERNSVDLPDNVIEHKHEGHIDSNVTVKDAVWLDDIPEEREQPSYQISKLSDVDGEIAVSGPAIQAAESGIIPGVATTVVENTCTDEAEKQD